MPFHPARHRITPWQLIAIILIVGLLVALLALSFEAGRERSLNPARTTAPPVPNPGPTPVAPAGPTVPDGKR